MKKNIELILKKQLNLKDVYVSNIDNHFKITAIGNLFKGISQVQRQQIIYKPLIDMIKEKHIHAVSIFAYTKDEWEKVKNK